MRCLAFAIVMMLSVGTVALTGVVLVSAASTAAMAGPTP
jgi:hypothetical protein